MKQKFKSKHDQIILDNDRYSRAIYEYYNEPDVARHPDRQSEYGKWRPNLESDVGLRMDPPRFQEDDLERHLLRCKYPIDELQKMASWLERCLEESVEDIGHVDERMFDAIAYIQLRSENFKMELELREEARATWEREQEQLNGEDRSDDVDKEPMGADRVGEGSSARQ